MCARWHRSVVPLVGCHRERPCQDGSSTDGPWFPNGSSTDGLWSSADGPWFPKRVVCGWPEAPWSSDGPWFQKRSRMRMASGRLRMARHLRTVVHVSPTRPVDPPWLWIAEFADPNAKLEFVARGQTGDALCEFGPTSGGTEIVETTRSGCGVRDARIRGHVCTCLSRCRSM